VNLRRIEALFFKDIFDAIRNYHILLLIATPVLLSLLFSSLFTESRSSTMMPRVGVMAAPDNNLLQYIKPQKMGLKLIFFSSRAELESKIAEGDVSFGLILPALVASAAETATKPRLTMIYPAETPEYTIERLQHSLEEELRKYLGKPAPPLPIDITWEPIGGNTGTKRSFGGDMFPMLVLMAMGMIGLLGLPLSIAEEREKRTLEALFLTPVTTGELIIGKCLFSFSLQIFTILAMVILNSRWDGHQPYFWLITVIGCIMFLFVGLLISSVAKTQGSVNAMGSSLFLCFQMVPTLSPTSDFLRMIAHLVPSTYVMQGLKKALFLDLTKVDIRSDILTLSVVTILLYLILTLSFRRLQVDR